MIEAVHGRAPSAFSAPRMISHMTSSMPSEPASRTYSRCGMRDSASGSAIRRVDELLVQGLVDESGARPLQLVAHAAGAPDLHVEILVEGLDGAAQRLPELVAAHARRAAGTARR